VLIRRACHEDVEDILKLWDQARSAAAVTPDDEQVVSRLIDHPGSVLLAIARFVRNL